MSIKLIFLIVLTILLFVCSPLLYGQTASSSKTAAPGTPDNKGSAATSLDNLIGIKGQNAPQFILPTMDGTEINLEKLRGKIVVINLWATFCPPCISEIPQLNSLVKKYQSGDVVFLAPTPDDKSALPGFLAQNSFDYQVLPNAFSVIKKYAPHEKSDDTDKSSQFKMILPTHLVIDQNGVVTFHEWGFSKDTVEKITGEIEKLLP